MIAQRRTRQNVESALADPTNMIDISDTQSHLAIDPDALINLVRRTLEAEGIERASISLAVVDDAAIREINRRYLGHDWPTDVISFPLSEPDELELAGELVVSAEMAAMTARQEGLDPWAELALYVVHGLLHLLGHDDQSADEARAMRRREQEVLSALNLPNTFPLAGSSRLGA
jgi:probable rRNA maturation factor